ncbi:MAG TPA: hypothetical protein VK210_09185, partial [Terriglobia bacterium]|nr:hypothetical protein [Terriglobia bacterium]
MPVTYQEVRDWQRSISAAFVALAFDLIDGVVVIGEAVDRASSAIGNSLGSIAKSTALRECPIISSQCTTVLVILIIQTAYTDIGHYGTKYAASF